MIIKNKLTFRLSMLELVLSVYTMTIGIMFWHTPTQYMQGSYLGQTLKYALPTFAIIAFIAGVITCYQSFTKIEKFTPKDTK